MCTVLVDRMSRRSKRKKRKFVGSEFTERDINIISNSDRVLRKKENKVRISDNKLNREHRRDLVDNYYRYVRKIRKMQNPISYHFEGFRERSGLANFDINRARICTRRKIKRRILFALKKTGKGARSRRRFNENSIVRC